jgi:hypothetical protein
MIISKSRFWQRFFDNLSLPWAEGIVTEEVFEGFLQRVKLGHGLWFVG